MTKDEINQLAMRDAETESPEGLRAAAGIYDRLTRSQSKVPAEMIQDDIWGTTPAQRIACVVRLRLRLG